MKKAAISIPVLCCVLALSACNNNDNDDPTPKTGVLIDTPVKGLDYQTGSRLGTTNEKGEFTYLEGDVITFGVGGLQLGTDDAAAEMSITAMRQTAEIAQILLTLDTDEDEKLIDVSGVVLTESVRNDLARILEDGEKGELSIESILTKDVLASIQEDSSSTLLHKETVSETVAAEYIRGLSETLNWDQSQLSDHIYFDRNTSGGIYIVLNDGGTGFIVMAVAEGVFGNPASWVLEENQKVLTLTQHTQSSGDFPFKVELLRKESYGDLEVFQRDVLQEVSTIEEFKSATPISSFAIEGKHFEEDVSSVSSPDCPGGYRRTHSFTNLEIVDNTVCYETDGSVRDFTTKVYARDTDPVIENTISGTRMEGSNSIDVKFATFDGFFSGGLVTQFLYTNGVMDTVRNDRRFTEVGQPVSNEPKAGS